MIAALPTLDLDALHRAIRHFVQSNASYAILDRYAGGTWLAGGCGILTHALCDLSRDHRPAIVGISSATGLEHLGTYVGNQVFDAQNRYHSLRRWQHEFEQRDTVKNTHVGIIQKHDLTNRSAGHEIVWDGGSDDAARMLNQFYKAELSKSSKT